MRITLESTAEVALVNGVSARAWTGNTERGNSIVAFITRIAAAEGAASDELAAELAEPPTRVVDPDGTTIAAPRSCTVCLARDVRRPAIQVARDASGLEWFECGKHDPTDNVAETIRVELEPIAAWFDRHCQPALAERVRLGQLRDRLALIVGEAFGWQPVSLSFDELLDALEREMNTQRTRLVNQSLELERDLAAARTSLMNASGWLVKDFHVLYRTARQLVDPSEPIVHGRASADFEALQVQLARLRPAFEACESERRGAPHRLTAAEREALTGLHRWLHSPNGDCDLIESAQTYHDQVEAQEPEQCVRLEADENGTREGARTLGHLLDDSERVRIIDTSRDVFARVGATLGIRMPTPEGPHEPCSGSDDPPATLTTAIVRTILDDERVSGPDSDTDAAALFLAHALNGARMGWHARVAHPHEMEKLAKLGAPEDEPKRTAWLFGFGVATRTHEDGDRPTEPEIIVEPPPVPQASGTGDAEAELRARGLDLACMNRGRVAVGLPTISAEQALARLDAAHEVIAATHREGKPS